MSSTELREIQNMGGDSVPQVPPEAKLITSAEVNKLPPASYVYFLSLAGECVYVGSTRNLKNRLPIHRSYNGPFDSIYYLSVPVGDRRYIERRWKLQLRPRYNTDCHKSTVDAAIADLPPDTILINSVSEAPPVSCVYFLCRNGRAFYVGKAANLRARLGSHKSQGRWFDVVKYLPCEPRRMAIVEKEMRAAFGPSVEGNTDLTGAIGRRPNRSGAKAKRMKQHYFRCTDEQWKLWLSVAGKGKLNSWIRDTLDRAAGR